MHEDKSSKLSRRSLLLQASMLVPLWQSAKLFEPAATPAQAAASAADEFVEVNGWILRRSDIA